MATKLFELEADLTLNSNQFVTDLSSAVDDAQSLAAEIESLNTQPDATSGTQLTNVLTDAGSVYDTISSAKTAADGTEEKINQIRDGGTSALSGLMDTFAGVAGMLVESVVAGIIEVGAESIEMAASADSPLADAYNKASESLTLTQDLAKMEIGNALLPIATSIQQLTDSVVSFVFRISDAEKLTSYLDQLETYEAENLQRVSENLQSVFGAFEQINKAEAADFTAMSAGVVSQTRFWADYAETLENLKARGVESSFLTDIADGSYESLQQLMALDALSDEDMQTFLASYEQLEAARTAAAESINATNVDVALATDNVNQTIADMVTNLDQSDMAELGMGGTMDAIIDAIGAKIPSLQSQVEAVKALVAEMAAATAVAEPEFGFTTNMFGSAFSGWNMADNPANPEASGLDYVPYDGYKAELHRGETVLTRQQAEERRNGTGGNTINPADLTAAVYDALARWGQPVGANAFGAILSPQISNDIAAKTRGVR